MLGMPAIYDLDHRRKIVDKFKDYAQIMSYPMPPVEMLAKIAGADRGILQDHQ